jgi:hypothetical protein
VRGNLRVAALVIHQECQELLHLRHDSESTGCLLYPKRDIPGDLGHVRMVLFSNVQIEIPLFS